MSNPTKTVFIRHSSGATHALSGRRLAKLLSELRVGRGQAELTALVMNGYSETLCGRDISSLEYETLLDEAR